jgi:hypothetical protein
MQRARKRAYHVRSAWLTMLGSMGAGYIWAMRKESASSPFLALRVEKVDCIELLSLVYLLFAENLMLQVSLVENAPARSGDGEIW